ncbi:hypothetical protein INT43_000986 [Umbelopsis isabellina]|uniref:Uncharacterized protein n=1 Tax=Mortierella isabellina TaxID=91625 RepID=A0A8H7Q369_MORIS|nr:hypothetical protein INT43_000986 [Umbelopsis isabellina]
MVSSADCSSKIVSHKAYSLTYKVDDMEMEQSSIGAYQSEEFSLFTPEQLKQFHEFHSYDWDNDVEFQKGLQAIYSDGPANDEELLKAKQFYFSRKKHHINLDQYRQFEEYLERSMPEKSEEEEETVFDRFDKYSFSSDERFLNGLPSIVAGIAKSKPGATVDKTFYDREMLKAKAFYFSKFVEKLDLGEYLSWKETKKVAPACPYAHLWQNKGVRETTELDQDDDVFLKTEQPITSSGALTITFSSPQSDNLLTCERLKELQETVGLAKNNDTYTSVIIASNCKQEKTPDSGPDEPITNVDHKSLSSGLAFNETATECGKDLNVLQSSMDFLQARYYSLVKDIGNYIKDEEKPVFHLIDGKVPFSAACLYFLPNQLRIVTEHALLTLGINSLSHAPIPPLYVLNGIQKAANSKAARVPPRGSALYVALAPPELILLRGPELLRLGLADYFVPDAKYVDTLKEMRNNAPCPAPHTLEAVKVVLEMNKAYAGPDKIGVWEKEIEKVFDGCQNSQDLLDKLDEMEKPWSRTIAHHLRQQSPTLLEMVIQAVKLVTEHSISLEECLDLEDRLNAIWRTTSDYKTFASRDTSTDMGDLSWSPLDSTVIDNLESLKKPAFSQEDISQFHWSPEPSAANAENTDSDAASSEVDEDEIFVCPVTGLRGKMPEGHSPVAIQQAT